MKTSNRGSHNQKGGGKLNPALKNEERQGGKTDDKTDDRNPAKWPKQRNVGTLCPLLFVALGRRSPFQILVRRSPFVFPFHP